VAADLKQNEWLVAAFTAWERERGSSRRNQKDIALADEEAFACPKTARALVIIRVLTRLRLRVNPSD
jgi:hypothetical protein